MTTITYVAAPSDSRCQWWSILLPEALELDGQRVKAPFLKRGADLELEVGQMLIDSEAMHHRKERGYCVRLGVALPDGEVGWLRPLLARKKYIKANGGQDLMRESGDVNGCVRMALWLRRQPDLQAAFEALKKHEPFE